MPRLVFDVQPIDRDDGSWWQSREENDAWVRKCWETWERPGEPRPCDCGYFADALLVTCDEAERKRCRADAPDRLQRRARHNHLSSLADKRKFPELPRCPMGTCYWCRQPIVHGRAKSRSMHDGREDEPECRHLYELHTRLEAQQNHLLRRDGRGCRGCGAMLGRFRPIWTDPSDERVAETWRTRGWIRERFAEQPAGPLTYLSWDTALEVDHFVPLALAFVGFPDPDRRRWFFSPANLRMLCHACHAAKTVEDRRMIREANMLGETWAKATILRTLADARLIRTIARTEGG